ncbi:3-oxoacyl-[acyl-carrier-protein] synthase III C-terminal domain-containing protein, partial [Thermovibrio sp.]
GSNEEFPYYVRMKGNEVFKVAVRTMVDSALRVLEKTGLSPKDISLLIPHQANLRIIRAVAERLGLPEEKVFVNLDKYGNTSAASIPIALDEALRSGRLKKGELALLVAFGGGFTWGSCVIKV